MDNQCVGRVVLSVKDPSVGESPVCLMPMEDLLGIVNFSAGSGSFLKQVANLSGASLRDLAMKYLTSAMVRLGSPSSSNFTAERLAIVPLDESVILTDNMKTIPREPSVLAVAPDISHTQTVSEDEQGETGTSVSESPLAKRPMIDVHEDKNNDPNLPVPPADDRYVFPIESEEKTDIAYNTSMDTEREEKNQQVPDGETADDVKPSLLDSEELSVDRARAVTKPQKQRQTTALKRKTRVSGVSTSQVHPCDSCDKIFKSPHSLRKHLIVHTEERPFICESCGKGYRSLSYLKTHALLHKGGRPRPHTCETCGKAFPTKNCLTSHSYVHTGEKPHICDQCAMGFSSIASLLRHQIIHTGEKFACKTCGKSFCRPQSLVQHERLHSGVKYTCDICNKSFTRKEKVKHHKLYVHSGYKPWACSLCDNTYSVKWKLDNHMRSHTGETPFACKLCHKTYRLAKSLRKHELKFHPKNESNDDKSDGNKL